MRLRLYWINSKPPYSMPKPPNFNEMLHDYLIAEELLDELRKTNAENTKAYKDTARVYANLDLEIGKYIDAMVKNVEGTLPEDEPSW